MSILSGEKPMPGTMFDGAKAACSIWAKKFCGFSLRVKWPTGISG